MTLRNRHMPPDIWRTCAACWKMLDIRIPHVSTDQDRQRFHLECWADRDIDATEGDHTFDDETPSTTEVACDLSRVLNMDQV